jgi:PKD repeat protein
MKKDAGLLILLLSLVSYNLAGRPFAIAEKGNTRANLLESPSASFVTQDSAWCQQASNWTTIEIEIVGSDTSTFDLEFTINGILATRTGVAAGIISMDINNVTGVNEYILTKITEYNGVTYEEAMLADTLTMTVYAIPEAGIYFSVDDPCSPVQVNFQSDTGYQTYAWNFGSGVISSSSNHIQNTFYYDYLDNLVVVGNDTILQDDSVFVITLEVENEEGCTGQVTDSITVYPVPVTDFFVHPDEQDYPDTTVFLTNLTSIGNWSYLWDYGDGTQDIVEEPGQHAYSSFGDFDILLTAYSDWCSDSISRTVKIKPPPAIAAFEPDIVEGCPPLSVAFSNHSLYAESFEWDFGDGGTSTDTNPIHVFKDTGVNVVKLVAIGSTSADSTEENVTVYALPAASFTVSPDTVSYDLAQIFQFNSNSLRATKNFWNFGDGAEGKGVTVEHSYHKEGIFTVALYAVSGQGCVDTLIMPDLIEVITGEGSARFPTAMVWKGAGPSDGYWKNLSPDDVNTIFHPVVVNVKDFNMMIYSRWGNRIFESNDPDIGWDGYMSDGRLAGEGVYFYKVLITYEDGIEEILQGDITFLHAK